VYNLRYHIASLVAVFLSLAVGLILGSVVVERGTLDRQQSTLVAGLNDEFSRIKNENDALNNDLRGYEGFAVSAVPALVSERLRGRVVVVLMNTGRSDGLSSVTRAISLAGGTPIVATFTRQGLGLDDPAVAKGLSAGSVIATTTFEEMRRSVVASIAQEWWRPGAYRALTDALVKAGVLRFDRTLPPAGVNGVVVMASWDGKADPLALALGQRMRDLGVGSVAAESLARPAGVTGPALEAGLSVVDDVDRPQGQVSVIFVLDGSAHGHFGVRRGADAGFAPLGK